MGEIKTNDLQEVKSSAMEGFRNIMPETGEKIKDVRDYWVKEINSLSGFGGDYSSLEDRIKCTPSEVNENYEYSGLRGNSFLRPSEKTEKGRAMIELLKEYGVEGIMYKNGEPIFSKCAEATVTIDNMTENRKDYRNTDGDMQKGNFSQADIKCAELWNKEKKDGRTDWTDEKVYDYRKANSLEWHERCDTETMDLLKHEIHAFFGHTGGVYECKNRNKAEFAGGIFDE